MVEHQPHFPTITALFCLDVDQFSRPPFTIGKLEIAVAGLCFSVSDSF